MTNQRVILYDARSLPPFPHRVNHYYFVPSRSTPIEQTIKTPQPGDLAEVLPGRENHHRTKHSRSNGEGVGQHQSESMTAGYVCTQIKKEKGTMYGELY